MSELTTTGSESKAALSPLLALGVGLAAALAIIGSTAFYLHRLVPRLAQQAPFRPDEHQVDQLRQLDAQVVVPGLFDRNGRTGGWRRPANAGGGPGGGGRNGNNGPGVGPDNMIRTNSYMVRVVAPRWPNQPIGPNNDFSFIFRQSRFGQLTEPVEFTIARRIVHEEAVGRQLAVTDAQMASLRKIVNTPALQAQYVSNLPVDAKLLQQVKNDWHAYTAANPSIKGFAENALVNSVDRACDSGVGHAKEDYQQLTTQINAVLKPEQIQAYKDGKSLAPPKPPTPTPAAKPATRPTPVRLATTRPTTRRSTTRRAQAATRPAAATLASTQPAAGVNASPIPPVQLTPATPSTQPAPSAVPMPTAPPAEPTVTPATTVPSTQPALSSVIPTTQPMTPQPMATAPPAVTSPLASPSTSSPPATQPAQTPSQMTVPVQPQTPTPATQPAGNPIISIPIPLATQPTPTMP